MKVFISWSGDKSKVVAETLRDWLPNIIQSLELFISTQDIPAGGRGMNVLASELEACSFGILCLTYENKDRPWLNFEAGALSKIIDFSSVVPLLLDLYPNDITGPIAQFQAIKAGSKDDIFGLVKALADLSGPPYIAEQRLKRTFDIFWSEYEDSINEALKSDASSEDRVARADRDVLEEVLTLSRRTERELTRLTRIRTGEYVLASRSRASSEVTPWWSSLVRKVTGDVMLRMHAETASRLDGFLTDDSGLHITIHGIDEEGDPGRLREIFADAAAKYAIPIHVRGEPIGDEVFDTE